MRTYLFLVEEGHVGFVEVGLAAALRHHSKDKSLKKREKRVGGVRFGFFFCRLSYGEESLR